NGSRTAAGHPSEACDRSSAIVSVLRAWIPRRPEPVSSRTDFGSRPPLIAMTAASTSRLLLPVPGPPRMRTRPRTPGSRTASASAPQVYDITACNHEGLTNSARPRADGPAWHHRRVSTDLHVHRYGPPG